MSATDVHIQFPFWVVLPPEIESPALAKECGTGQLPIAFSTTDMMMPYLAARKGGDWKVRLIGPGALLLLIADLHQWDAHALCLDLKPDGSAGTEVPLSELMKLTA